MKPLSLPGRERDALQAFMQRQGLDASVQGTGGRLRLRVDARYPVDLVPAGAGGIVLLSNLAAIDAWPASRADDILVRLLELSAAVVRDHPAGLAIDTRSQRLQLQQPAPQESGVDAMEAAVADFVNLLVFWSEACRREADRASDRPGASPFLLR